MSVTVLTQPNCVPCTRVKSWFDTKGVEYIERDVTADVEALDLLKSLNYSQTPVVVTDSSHWSGINL